MKAYYNEIDPGKAEWLRQLMAKDVITKGTVDERSITEITPSELEGYTRCGFFAGIGIWDYALRLAGWPEEREVWHGSAPCQPFSVAGQGKGTADERHLWPAWFRLIAERRPVVVFGEQVADGDGQTWLDAVQSDMESIDYRFGSVALPAAGFGAPHGRHRTFFVADTKENRGLTLSAGQERKQESDAMRKFTARGMAESASSERRGWPLDAQGQQSDRQAGERDESQRDAERDSATGHMAHNSQDGCGQGCQNGGGLREGTTTPQQRPGLADCGNAGELGDTNEAGPQGWRLLGTTEIGCGKNGQAIGAGSPVNGFWHDAEWLPCTDGKARAVKPQSFTVVDGIAPDILRMCDTSFPLVKGAEARVLRLRGYGDGIVATVAAEFIKAYMRERQTLTPLNDA